VLLDVYQKHLRSFLKLAVPAWHGAISQGVRNEIERVQKAAHHIVLGECYLLYKSALRSTGKLKSRRDKLCVKFARKAEKHQKH
jgi:hypothetical protein